MKAVEIVDKNKASLDEKGIWVAKIDEDEDLRYTREAWKRIYDFDMEKLDTETGIYNRDKMEDHLKYILEGASLSENSVYVEIGCGPAYVGRMLMEDYGCTFVGVDFNYEVLKLLKCYFERENLTNYILIYADVGNLPLKNDSVDLIYGGGVIEHVRNPQVIVMELYRVVKESGVVFNTVPAFNLFWLTRSFMSIPSIPVLKNLFGFIHVKVLKRKLLSKRFGYELSITKGDLKDFHKSAGFRKVGIGPFAFHANHDKLKSDILGEIFYFINSIDLLCAFYYVRAKK